MKCSTPEAYNLMHEGAIALAEISSNGIKIDEEYLKKTRKSLQNRIRECEEKLKSHEYWKLWKRQYGNKALLTSNDQLGSLLYKTLKFPIPYYTDKGKPSTDAQALEKINDPFVRDWNRMTKYQKADGTFLAGIQRETRQSILRAFFNLHTTVTYRSSSDSPNFQNFPIRDPEIAKIIRSCFIPRDGRRLVEIDCSGVEVRISACYHKDPMMIKYIMDPTTDMHRDMACELFICKPEQVTKPARHTAKNGFVFPEFYGSYWKNVAPDLWDAMEMRNLTIATKNGEVPIREHLAKKGITVLGSRSEPELPSEYALHVKQVEERFWKQRFKVYDQWKRDTYSEYLKNGGWMTKTGFYVTGLYRKNDVTNHPIQGSAFHCLLWSLIQMQKWLKKYKMKTLIIGQIHDSAVFDAVEKELQDVLNKWNEIMTVNLRKHWDWIIVPIEVEVEACEIGASWFNKTPWTKTNGLWHPSKA